MELSEKQKGDLIRLFNDEGMVETLTAVCEMNCDDFKHASYVKASSPAPDLVEITQLACKALAFEEMPAILRSMFDKTQREEEAANG